MTAPDPRAPVAGGQGRDGWDTVESILWIVLVVAALAFVGLLCYAGIFGRVGNEHAAPPIVREE